MAARWGAGEEILTACNMDFFPLNTLDETADLNSEDSMEALQNCLDPSILSIFEDSPSIETKGMDEESEATLLTALTEILDNVDEENLSPFDTLPESDLLSGQKGTDHSPLRRLLNLPRSSPEKDALCMSRPFSVGKVLARKHPDSLQRSDGEEEEDCSLTQSPVQHDLLLDNNLLDWEGLTLPLPVTFEQETDKGGSISLGDLVRHMHPYCMTICVENDDGQQILPEGGILLEVVDQDENGEPILAIPDIELTASLPIKEQTSENDQMASDKIDVASDSSEHIVVDDEDETLHKPVKVQTLDLCSNVIDESITEGQEKKFKAKSPPHRKKKKKCKKLCPSDTAPVQGRVLRSSSRKNTTEVPTKPEKNIIEGKKSKVSKVTLFQKSKIHTLQTETEPEITSTALPADNGKLSPSVPSKDHTVQFSVSAQNTQSICPFEDASSTLPKEMPKQMVPATEDCPDQTRPVASCSSAAAKSVAPQMTQAFSEALPPVAPVIPEPKPKSLSLEEYRLLRRQKKPDPAEKQHNNRTKWPSLPELPTELPPIPCLPEPSPRDPRRSQPPSVKKEVDDIKPAWQPRGPCAPPTPEALLVPPSYMATSSNKASSAPAVSQQAPQSKSDITLKPNLSQKILETVPSTVNTVHETTTAVHSESQSAECPSIIQPVQPTASDQNCSTVSVDKNETLSQPVSTTHLEQSTMPSKTSTETIKVTVATVPISSFPQKTVISQQVPDLTASTSSQCTFADPAAHLSSSAHPFNPKTQKQEFVLMKEKNITAAECSHAKSPTQELIESFTSEIGIEAADLTSLLEQFEETQAKEEQSVLEVSGRAAAVGNSRVEFPLEKTVVERIRAKEALGTAALTPPATPPHQMWKPLVSVAVTGKNKTTESMPSAPKVIQIEARPLSSVKSRCKPNAPSTITPEMACMDHDYCLPTKVASPKESVKRWNVKQQSFITIKPIRHPATATLRTPPPASKSSAESTKNLIVTTTTQEIPLPELFDHRADEMEKSSILDSPDASPAQQDDDDAAVEEVSPRKGPFGRSYHWHANSHTPSSRTSPKDRTGGKYRKRSHLSPSPKLSCSDSDSYSSRSRSRSCSPAEKRYRSHRSQSSSISSSRSSSRSSSSASPSPPRRRKHSYSSSRSGSWSRSRSRSPQRHTQWTRSRRLYSPSYKRGNSHCPKTITEDMKRRKEKAIEERRVVYVGRIRGTMTQRELKERFSYFGEIEECTLHFRDHGDNYGFVTYYNTKDAFTAIENGGKLRKPDELPFDLCFGGRRQFCQTSYSDLDSNREYDPLAAKGKYNALDFDTLLKQAQQNLKR